MDSERKQVIASSPGSLACPLIDLGAFWYLGTHLPSEKSILPYFSSLSMVTVSVPFPEVRSRKETESGLRNVRFKFSMPSLFGTVGWFHKKSQSGLTKIEVST